MEIHIEAVDCASSYIQFERRLLGVLLTIDQDRIFETYGFTHLTPYCIKALGLSEDISKCFVRVVRKSHEVPELAAAVVNGEISLHKARTVSSVITPENKEEWLEKCRKLPKSVLEKECALARGQLKKQVRLDLSYETDAKFERAREILSTKRKELVSLEDTLDWMLDEALQRHDPVEKAKRARGTSVHHQVVARDGDRCQWVYEDGSKCEERKWIDHHHIVPRAEGGPDTVDNMVSLCAGHHRMVHREAAQGSRDHSIPHDPPLN